jgi:initiation of chromosome replication (DNA synthesis)
MEDKVINILKDRTISISKIILKNYKKLNISDTELIIIMVLMSFGDKVMYNPEELASVTNADKYEVMSVINKLVEKNIISFEVEKIDKKTYEYLSLDLFYDKLFNLIIDKPMERKVDVSVFDTFERELGRTLSPMEYEQIKEWVNSGNSDEMIAYALREAVLNGVSNFRYIDSILNEWKKKGYKNKNDITRDRENYRSKKGKVSVYDTDWLNEQ